jgi:hypothetical protein
VNENELSARAELLPDTFADRVGGELEILRSLAHAGEWAELLDDLLATLTKNQKPVTVKERDELKALATAMGMEPRSLNNLNVSG